MLKMKLQYFAFLMWRAKSLEKTLMLGKTEGRRRIGQQRWDSWMASATQWTWVWANSRDSERQGSLACCSSRGHRVGHDLATKQVTICEQLNQWPKSNSLSYLFVVIHYLFWLWSSVNGEINLLFKTDIVCAVKSGFSFERGRHRGTQESHHWGCRSWWNKKQFHCTSSRICLRIQVSGLGLTARLHVTLRAFILFSASTINVAESSVLFNPIRWRKGEMSRVPSLIRKRNLKYLCLLQ